MPAAISVTRTEQGFVGTCSCGWTGTVRLTVPWRDGDAYGKAAGDAYTHQRSEHQKHRVLPPLRIVPSLDEPDGGRRGD